ncbi:MAG: 50S ribosomal protein L4 [Desulfurococcales archaeon]|nr:50S ribosomal protein L4 [Desulfurococcales archaeon]
MTHKIILLRKLQAITVPVYDLDGKRVGDVTLPPVFSFPVRKDLIRRAFHSAMTARLQPKGRDPLAGKRRVGESWGINHSVARVPRLDNGRAVFAPMTRGGRLTHPPRVEKVLHEEVNKKERIRAIASALAATAAPEIVRDRGHRFTCEKLPVIVSDEFEDIGRTGQGKEILKKLCVWEDILRAYEGRRIRAGKGKMRGRKYITPKSVLIVVSEGDAKVVKALRNLPGVDVISTDLLSVLHLAPGGVPGRLTIYTMKALSQIENRFEVITP